MSLPAAQQSDQTTGIVERLIAGGNPLSIWQSLIAANRAGEWEDFLSAWDEAETFLAKTERTSNAVHRGVMIYRLQAVYLKALSNDDFRAALDAQREIGKLLDLYRAPQIDGAGMVSVAVVRAQWETFIGVLEEALKDAVRNVAPDLCKPKTPKTIAKRLHAAIMGAFHRALEVGVQGSEATHPDAD